MKIWLNGNLRASQQKTLTAGDLSAAFRGGVYETIAFRNGQPKLLSAHFQRLRDGLTRLGCAFDYSDDQLELALHDTVTANALTDAWTRILVAPQGLYGLSPEKTLVMVTAAPLPNRSQPLRLQVSPYRRNRYAATAGIKAATWIENDLISEKAKQNGFDGALLIDSDGFVSECPNANVFVVMNNQLFTPSVHTGCLAGVVRNFVCSQMLVTEAEFLLRDVANATEMFVTSAISGVQSVSSLTLDDETVVSLASDAGPFTQQAKEFYTQST